MAGETEVVPAANGALPMTGLLPAGTAMTETFTGSDLARSAETAMSAVSAAAIATVQAQYIVAQKRPRDLDSVRLALLKECRRPGFAAVARYRKPIGEGIEGPSIRFAEAAMRCLGNLSPTIRVIYDDPEKRIVSVAVTDLEVNLCFSIDIVVDKTVERSKLKDGQVPIKARKNSIGKVTYLVEATEDEIQAKQGALVSKAMRDQAMRVLPGDIKDECMAQVIATLEAEDAADPTAARKKLVDGFDRLGVKPSGLRDYLGHDLDVVTPAEMAELRAVGLAIRDGETTWKDAIEHKLRTSKAAAVAAGEAQPTSIKEKAKAKAAAGKQAASAQVPLATKPVVEPSDADEDEELEDEETDPLTGERVPPATGT